MRRLVTAVATLWLLAAVSACRRAETSPAPAKPQSASTSPDDYESLPSRDKFAGSEACRDCHEKNYGRWSHDYHALALSKPAPATVAGQFDDAHFRGESSEAWMRRRGDDYVMRTRNREGQLLDYPVQWLIGAKRMQDAVTVMDDGRWQVLPVYFHITAGGAMPHQWVDYNEFKQGRVGPEHPFFWTNFRRTANRECLECHTTGLDVHYDRATHTWSTTFADAGVACEACHGPGARHAETKEKVDIVRPDHIDKELGLAICARCHGPHEPLFPVLDAHDAFRPGRTYGDYYTPLVVTDGTARSGEFFADGRPSSSSFEYQALIQSRCYRAGGATCLTCHDAPHAAKAKDELRSADPDASCVKCHAMPAEHSHHKSATCVDCHMPKVLSGVLDKLADHSLDVPNVENTIRHKIPNACGVCHGDVPAATLAAQASKFWPALAQRNVRRIRLADAIDEATASASLGALQDVVADRTEAPTLRGAAAELLGQRFPQLASAALTPLLRDADPLVRAKAVEALGYANARADAEELAPLLSDSSLSVRQLAALVLGSWGDPRGVDALAKLAADPATRGLARPHILLGVSAANRGDFATASREIGLALDLVPYGTDALVFMADIHVRTGDPAAARKDLEEALRFDPAHPGAHRRLAALNAPLR
jgi:hypothetical protein